MTYEEGILAIPKQFGYKPEIINKEKIRPFKRIIVLGMGGSRLGADILNMARPDLDIVIHSDYQLPPLSAELLQEALIIANSYSGDTQETISGAKEAVRLGYNLAIVSAGGELRELAERGGIPHVVVPHSELPARLNVGTNIIALSALAGIDIKNFQKISTLAMAEIQKESLTVADTINAGVPIIYVTERFNALGYCWKVILNETAKIPAFCNRFPEVAHNEIESYASGLARQFRWVMIQDSDATEVTAKMHHAETMFKEKGISGVSLELAGNDIAEQIVSSFILAHFTALELANKSGVDPLVATEIEDLKKVT